MIILALALALAATPGSSVEPMLDGNCDDHAQAARAIKVREGVQLYLRQTKDHVWICFTAPPQSFATADLVIETPLQKAPINLHASAQLGEWSPDDKATWLTTPTDDRWWKVSGWTGTTNRFRPSGGGKKLEFFPAPGRELQISKARFGRGEWKIRLAINGLKEGDGMKGAVRWPSDGSTYRLRVR